jgi:hypothetical protein
MLVIAIKRLAIWLAFAFVLLIVLKPLLKFLTSLIVSLVIFFVCGQAMQCKNLDWQGKDIVVLSPYFEDGSFAADKLSFAFSTQENTFFPIITVSIQNPQCYVDHEIVQKWQKFFFEKDKWLHAFLDIEVENGWIGWQVKQALHQFTFDCKPRFKQEKLVHIYLSSPEFKKNLLSLSFVNEAANFMSIQADLNDIDSRALLFLLQLIHPNYCQWEIFSGSCSGAVKMNVPYRKIEGLLMIEQLSLAAKNQSIYTYIPKCSLVIEKNSDTKSEKKSPIMGIWTVHEPAYCSVFTQSYFFCADVTGTGSFQFGNIINNSFTEADFFLSNSCCYFLQTPSFFSIEDRIHVSLQKNCNLTSYAYFFHKKLKGEASIDWRKDHVEFSIEADFEQFKELLPLSVRYNLQSEFSPRIILDGHFKKEKQEYEIKGNIKLLVSSTIAPSIDFECKWEKKSSFTIEPTIYLSCKQTPLSLLTNIFNSLKSIQIEGFADINIALNPFYLNLQGEITKTIIENKDFQFTFIPPEEKTFSIMSGNYQIDFATKQQKGTLPIQNGQFVMKNEALCINEIEGLLVYDYSYYKMPRDVAKVFIALDQLHIKMFNRVLSYTYIFHSFLVKFHLYKRS